MHLILYRRWNRTRIYLCLFRFRSRRAPRCGTRSVARRFKVALGHRYPSSRLSEDHLPFQYLALFIFLALSFGKALLGIICRNPRMTSTGFIDFFTAFIVFGLAWLVVMPFVLYFGAG